MRRMAFCILVVVSASVAATYGAENTAESVQAVVDKNMSATRLHEQRQLRSEEVVKTYGASIIPCLRPYFRDESEDVRWEAYSLVWLVGRECTDMNARREVVDLLTNGLMDDQVGLDSTLLGRLCSFRADDFSDDAKATLTKALPRATAKPPTIPRGATFLVTGVANMREALPTLKKYSYDGSQGVSDTVQKNRWFDSSRWSALRARARMDVKEDIELCIELVKAHPDRDQRAAELLRSLAYVRQPEVLEYIRPFLFSDHLYDVGDSIDMVAVSEGQWAAAALGQMLEGFPWTMDSPATESALEECRAWMKNRTGYTLIR